MGCMGCGMTNAETLAAGIARRHDLDALRAFAMLLGIVLHGALAFIPGAWVVTDVSVEGDGTPFAWLTMAIHGFRMPLFFLMSGFFTAMLWRQRGLRALARQRAQRLLLPLAIAMFTVIPLTAAAWSYAAGASTVDEDGGPGAGVEVAAKDNVWAAAALGDIVAMERHASAGAPLDAYDPTFGVTPLSWAVLHGRGQAAEWLLDNRGDVGTRNRDGSTALHSAAFMGRPEIVRCCWTAARMRMLWTRTAHVRSTAVARTQGPPRGLRNCWGYRTTRQRWRRGVRKPRNSWTARRSGRTQPAAWRRTATAETQR